MQKKKIFLIGSLCGFLGLGVLGVSQHINNGLVARADNSTSYTRNMLLSADTLDLSSLNNGSGDFVYAGLTFHTNGLTVNNGNLVLASSCVLYNVTLTGDSVSATGKVGKGFSSLSFADLDAKAGAVAYSHTGTTVLVGHDLTSSDTVDFTNDNGEVRRFELNAGGTGDMTFKSLLVTYVCDDQEPIISLGDDVSLETGESVTITTSASYTTGTLTYSYLSNDTSVVTVSGSTDTATLNAVGIGSTTVQVTVNDNNGSYTDTINVTVTAALRNILTLDSSHFDVGPGEGDVAKNNSSIWTNAGTTASVNNGTLTVNVPSGSTFWSTQFFWVDPYKDNNRQYRVIADINVNQAADIDINFNNVSLSAGDNHIDLTVNHFSTASIGIMFGSRSSNTASPATYTITNFQIKDLLNARYVATFVYPDNSEIEVPAFGGAALYAMPANPVSADETFIEWRDASDNAFTSSTLVNGDITLHPHFESEVVLHTVTIKTGTTTYQELEVVDGYQADLSLVNTPFGYDIVGYYTDSNLENEFDNSVIEDDLTLYMKRRISTSKTWINGGSYVIPDSYKSYDDLTGALTLTYNGWNGDAYFVQLNFDLPAGSYNYTINYVYSINVSGADLQIYDSGTKGGVKTLEVGDEIEDILSYSGTLSSGNKLTFELGATSGNTVFTLHQISLTYTAL